MKKIQNYKLVKQKKERKEIMYATVLKEIETEHGILTAPMVVEAAQKPDSPLHNYFEWDDSVAAKNYRLWQARVLISNVQVQVLGKKTDAYVNVIVNVNDFPQRGYVPMERSLTDAEIYRQVLSNARRELEYWQNKYKTIRDLQGVINPEKLEELKRKTK